MLSGFIICGTIGLLLIIMSVALFMGRGSFLIAGYNTMSKSEKEKYDVRALCRFMSIILFPIGILTALLGVFIFLESESVLSWFIWVFLAASLGISLFAAIYANTGNRFKK